MLSGLPITGFLFRYDGRWQLSWDAIPGVTYYRIVLYGREVLKVTTNSVVLSIPGSFTLTPPPVEVMVEGEPANSELYLAYLVMQWYGEKCDEYIVEEIVGTSLTKRGVVRENGATVYTVTTPTLPDGESHTYQIHAETQSLKGAPQLFAITVMCPPVFDERDFSLDYDTLTQSVLVKET